MKNGSNAGSTSVTHSDIPFLAEYSAVSGNTTISRQHTTARIIAIVYRFIPDLKISMVYFIHKTMDICSALKYIIFSIFLRPL